MARPQAPAKSTECLGKGTQPLAEEAPDHLPIMNSVGRTYGRFRKGQARGWVVQAVRVVAASFSKREMESLGD